MTRPRPDIIDTGDAALLDLVDAGDDGLTEVYDDSIAFDIKLDADLHTDVVTPGDESIVQVNDAFVTRQIDAVVKTGFRIIATGHTERGLTFMGLDPDIGEVGADGIVLPATTNPDPALVRVNVSNGHVTRQVAGYVFYSDPGSQDTFDHWDPGSIAEAMTNTVDPLLAATTPAAGMPIYAATSPTFARNTDCLIHELNPTGIAAFNSRTGDARPGGFNITPDSALISEHFPAGLQAGDTMTFFEIDNTPRVMTIAAVADVGPANSADGYATDGRVIRYTSPLPIGIEYYPFFGGDFYDLLRELRWRVPAFVLNQYRRVHVADIWNIVGSINLDKPASVSPRFPYYEPAISYDSGMPVFAAIANRLVALSTLTYSGSGSGPAWHERLAAINAALLETGSAYEVSVFDPGGLNNYG